MNLKLGSCYDNYVQEVKMTCISYGSISNNSYHWLSDLNIWIKSLKYRLYTDSGWHADS